MFLLLWAVILCVGVVRGSTVPVIIRKSDVRNGEHVIVASLFVGMPPESVELEVRFDVSGIVLYRDQKIHSDRYERAPDGRSGTDSVFFGTSEKYMRIVDGTGGRVAGLARSILCTRCSGILGLRRDSDVWQWWPTASFTPGAITFGSHVPSLPRDATREHLFHCENRTGSAGSLCTIRGSCMGRELWTSLDPGAPHVLLPSKLRNRFLRGKNIYSHDAWETLDLILNPGTGSPPIALPLDHEDLSGQHGTEARELLVLSSTDNTTMTIGSSILWKYAIHYDQIRDTLILREHSVVPHLSTSYVVLYVIASFLLIRHKMLASEQHYALDPRGTTSHTATVIFETFGWGITVLLLFLPGVVDVLLPDFADLYGITAAIVAVGGIVPVLARVYIARIRRLRGSKKTPFLYHVLLAETVWFEAVLFSALWLSIVPRRREGVASVLTAFAAGWALYSFVGYACQWLTYMSVVGKGVVRQAPIWIVVFTGLSILLLLAHYSFAFVFVFMHPFLERVGMMYADLALATTLLLSAIIVAASAEISRAHVFRVVAIQVRDRIAKIDAATERDRP